MSRDDLPQVSKIDKEAFPTQWPPTNYRSELQNNLARYLVVYKEGLNIMPELAIENKGLINWFRRFFRSKQNTIKSNSIDFIVGFIGGWIMADELHVTEIAVRESYRRQGIGHLMLIYMVEIGMMLKVRYATLEVRLTNMAAQKLYEKFGFEKVGFRKAYYSDNREDALIMTTGNITSPEYKRRISEIKNELIVRLVVPNFLSIQDLEDTKTVAH